jgi:hypothetical protein
VPFRGCFGLFLCCCKHPSKVRLSWTNEAGLSQLRTTTSHTFLTIY